MSKWEMREPPPWMEFEPPGGGLPDVIPAWLLEEPSLTRAPFGPLRGL